MQHSLIGDVAEDLRKDHTLGIRRWEALRQTMALRDESPACLLLQVRSTNLMEVDVNLTGWKPFLAALLKKLLQLGREEHWGSSPIYSSPLFLACTSVGLVDAALLEELRAMKHTDLFTSALELALLLDRFNALPHKAGQLVKFWSTLDLGRIILLCCRQHVEVRRHLWTEEMGFDGSSPFGPWKSILEPPIRLLLHTASFQYVAMDYLLGDKFFLVENPGNGWCLWYSIAMFVAFSRWDSGVKAVMELFGGERTFAKAKTFQELGPSMLRCFSCWVQSAFKGGKKAFCEHILKLCTDENEDCGKLYDALVRYEGRPEEYGTDWSDPEMPFLALFPTVLDALGSLVGGGMPGKNCHPRFRFYSLTISSGSSIFSIHTDYARGLIDPEHLAPHCIVSIFNVQFLNDIGSSSLTNIDKSSQMGHFVSMFFQDKQLKPLETPRDFCANWAPESLQPLSAIH